DTTISNKDTNKSTDIFVSFINRKPDFYIANQTVCKNAGIQDAHIIQNVSDGDYLGVNQSLAYTTVSNSNPDLFGGLLGAGGEPFGSWPSNVIHYQPLRGATGTAEICINAKDNGGTYCNGEDNYTHCFNITVDASCDDGAGDIFKVEFPNLYLNFARGRNLFDQNKSGYSYVATVNNKGAASSEPATFKLAVENADSVSTADSRCSGDTLTGEYVCNLDGVPAGKTEIAFEVRASNPDDVRASLIEVEPGHADLERSTDTGAGSAAAGDTSAPGSNEGSGGGSLGWLSLLGLALFRRRR
ncbi:MAG TPA: GlyGly-CTERM sorting domain-containing protein, partial [Crenotrichaceae bacterium]|nr:GlyGly-CTERM sorting domain-containing protein [Crenotrichaceae bacterium]